MLPGLINLIGKYDNLNTMAGVMIDDELFRNKIVIKSLQTVLKPEYISHWEDRHSQAVQETL